MGDRFASLDQAVEDLARGHAADVIVIGDTADQHLEGGVGVRHRRGDAITDHLEKRLEIIGFISQFPFGEAELGAGVDDGKIELCFVGVEFAEEVEDHVDHLFRASARAVDLVDYNDWLDPQIEGFLQHETGLRHRPVEGIDQQQH